MNWKYLISTISTALLLIAIRGLTDNLFVIYIFSVFFALSYLIFFNRKLIFLTVVIPGITIMFYLVVYKDLTGVLLILPNLFTMLVLVMLRLTTSFSRRTKLYIAGGLSIVFTALSLLLLNIYQGFFHPYYISVQVQSIVLHDSVLNSSFLKDILATGSFFNTIGLLSYYASRMLIGILIGLNLISTIVFWHFSLPFKQKKKFREYKGDPIYLIGVIVALITLVIGLNWNYPTLVFVGLNGLVIYGMVLSFFGLAFLTKILRGFNFFSLIAIIVIPLAATFGILLLVLLGLINCFIGENTFGGEDNENNIERRC